VLLVHRTPTGRCVDRLCVLGAIMRPGWPGRNHTRQRSFRGNSGEFLRTGPLVPPDGHVENGGDREPPRGGCPWRRVGASSSVRSQWCSS
jgi:hypothetical protein